VNWIAKKTVLLLLLILVSAGQVRAFSFDWFNQYLTKNTWVATAGAAGLAFFGYYAYRYYLHKKAIPKNSDKSLPGDSSNASMQTFPLLALPPEMHQYIADKVSKDVYETDRAFEKRLENVDYERGFFIKGNYYCINTKTGDFVERPSNTNTEKIIVSVDSLFGIFKKTKPTIKLIAPSPDWKKVSALRVTGSSEPYSLHVFDLSKNKRISYEIPQCIQAAFSDVLLGFAMSSDGTMAAFVTLQEIMLWGLKEKKVTFYSLGEKFINSEEASWIRSLSGVLPYKLAKQVSQGAIGFNKQGTLLGLHLKYQSIDLSKPETQDALAPHETRFTTYDVTGKGKLQARRLPHLGKIFRAMGVCKDFYAQQSLSIQ
jgi:hypothetical protein